MFLKIKADSGDRSPYGSFWFSDVPYRDGGPVSSDQALRLTVVYRCVRLLSESLSILPFELYSPRADGGRDKIKNHWLYRLIAVRPNQWQNPLQFRNMLQTQLELRGNAFARIFANSRGEVTDLVPIHPDRVTVEMLSDDSWRYRVRNKDGSETILNRGQMFHRWDLSLDGICGLNPVACAREAMATGLAAQSYGMRFFQNNAVPNGWVEMNKQFRTDEDRNTYKEALQRTLTGRNQGKIAVFELGEKYNSTQISNADAEFILTKKYTVTDIARLYGVPPHKVADLDKSAFSNIEQQSLDFVNDAVMPRSLGWAAALKYEFIADDDNLEIDFPTAILLRADSGARATANQKGILTGWLTRNEVRIDEGRNPIDGLDEPLQPSNMMQAGDDPSTPADQSTKPPKGPGALAYRNKSALAAPQDNRLVALASAAAERVARKEIEVVRKAYQSKEPVESLRVAYERHAAFVASALGVDMSAAEQYCIEQLEAAMFHKEQSPDDFQALARCKLERLAIGQTETDPTLQVAQALGRIAGAISQQRPAQINVEKLSTQVSLNLPDRRMERTVTERDERGLVKTVVETETST